MRMETVAGLTGPGLKVQWDGETGNLCSLRGAADGDEVLKLFAQAPRPACALGFLLPGGPVVQADSGRPTSVEELHGSRPGRPGARNGLRLRFDGFWAGERRFAAKATVWWEFSADGGVLHLSIEIENHEPGLDIVEVLFPRLSGILLEDSPANENLVVPHHAGEWIRNPAATLASERYRRFSRAGSRAEPGGFFSRELNYCGLASMPWMDCFGAAQGLYLCACDPAFDLTGLRVETGGPASPWLGLAIRKHVRIGPGQRWQSAVYELALHPGDWHWAARRYRAWFDTVVQQETVPLALRQMAAVNPRYDFKNGGRVQHRFCEIPELYDAGVEYGMEHFFIAGWNRSGFDRDYPEYHPDLELGSPLDLEQGCAYIRSRGGTVSFYINARLFDMDSDYFGSLGKEWAIRDPSGEFMRETYEPRTFAVMCPACAEWRRHLADTAAWMVKAYHAQGIYLDQLGSATPWPCFAAHHQHLTPGEFNRGYLALLDQVRAAIQAVDPAAFLMIENCGDIYSSKVFGSLTWNGELYDEFFNIYKYTFPEHIQINMVHPRHMEDPDLRREYFYKDLDRAMVLGSVFWAAPGRRFEPADRDLLQVFREALAFRKALAPYIAQGRFVDTDGLVLPDGLTASRWRMPSTQGGGAPGGGAPAGDELVLCVNPQNQPGQKIGLCCTAPADAAGEAGRCRALVLEPGKGWAEAEVQESGGVAWVQASSARYSAVLLERGGKRHV
ncbi:MAG: hypothetical protein IMW99_09965 [Firmicutes bacterium]|nr:hypothetical protein [Bacillota bacterium]